MNGQKNNRSLAWVAAVALFMQSLDATILNTALPAISADLHQSPLEMQMAIISYALTVALFIPLSGWLADKFGTLKVFRFAVAVFVLGSIACAASHSLNLLILSRILQGFGGALMMPVARLSILRTVPKTQLLPVWNLMAMAGLTGPVVGPILGGWLVTYASWHWIFLINIPIGLLGIYLAGLYMPNVTAKVRRLDWVGFALFSGGLAGITLGLDLISEAAVLQWRTVLIIGGGLLFLLFYYLYARQVRNALVPLSLFRIRTFSIGIAGNLFIRLCGSGIPFLLPLMLQVVFQYGADKAGWMIAPIALSSILSKPVTAKLLIRFGYKMTLIYTALCMTVIVALMFFLRAGTPVWQYVALATAYGATISVMFTSVNTLTVSDLNRHYASAGSTVQSVVQQVGIGIGIAVSAVILNLYRDLFGTGPEQLQQAFSHTFLTTSLFGLALVLIFTKLHRSDGEQLHRR